MNGIFLAVCTGSHFCFNCSGFPFDQKTKKVKKTILFFMVFALLAHSSSKLKTRPLLASQREEGPREGREVATMSVFAAPSGL
jgi:hypothetical protein